jgi:hypothetical protein
LHAAREIFPPLRARTLKSTEGLPFLLRDFVRELFRRLLEKGRAMGAMHRVFQPIVSIEWSMEAGRKLAPFPLGGTIERSRGLVSSLMANGNSRQHEFLLRQLVALVAQTEVLFQSQPVRIGNVNFRSIGRVRRYKQPEFMKIQMSIL